MKEVKGKDLVVGVVYRDMPEKGLFATYLEFVRYDEEGGKWFKHIAGDTTYYILNGLIGFQSKDDYYEIDPSELPFSKTY